MCTLLTLWAHDRLDWVVCWLSCELCVLVTYLRKGVFELTLLKGLAVEICSLIGQFCNHSIFHLVYWEKTLLENWPQKQTSVRSQSEQSSLNQHMTRSSAALIANMRSYFKASRAAAVNLLMAETFLHRDVFTPRHSEKTWLLASHKCENSFTTIKITTKQIRGLFFFNKGLLYDVTYKTIFCKSLPTT